MTQKEKRYAKITAKGNLSRDQYIVLIKGINVLIKNIGTGKTYVMHSTVFEEQFVELA